MAELFQTTPQNVTLHLKSIFEDGELQEEATCKDYLQVRKGLLLSRPWLEPLTNAKSPSRRDAGKIEIYFVSQGVGLLRIPLSWTYSQQERKRKSAMTPVERDELCALAALHLCVSTIPPYFE